MKVMGLGDVHGNVPFAANAIEYADSHDATVILQVGDLGFWEHEPAGVHFLDETNDRLKEANILLVFCDGNHCNFDLLENYRVDDDGFRRIRSNIWHAPRGHIWTWDGVMFMAMGGAHSIDGPGGIWGQTRGPGNGWWPQETITDEDVEHALAEIGKVDHIDVMIGHDCPSGVSIPGIKGYPLADINRQRLAQVVDEAAPQLFIGGHYHLRHTSIRKRTRVEILGADVTPGDAYMQTLFLDTNPFRLFTRDDTDAFAPVR